MAFLAFAEPGNAGYARVSAQGLAADAPRVTAPAEDRPVLSELERSVIGLARGDGLSTLRQPGRLSRGLELVFGVRISPMLADPKLEALRRVAVLSWKRGYAIASAEVKALSSSPSPTSRRWPMLMKAGTAAFFGPRVRDIIAPMWGHATDCGGA